MKETNCWCKKKISNHGLGLRSMEKNLEFLFLVGFMRSIKSIQQAFPHFNRILQYTIEGSHASNVNLLTRCPLCPLCTDCLVKGCKSYCLKRLLMSARNLCVAARQNTTWTRQTCGESSRRLVWLEPDFWSTRQSELALHRYLDIPASAANKNSKDSEWGSCVPWKKLLGKSQPN